MRALRFLRIVDTIGRHGLDEFLPGRGVVARAYFGTFYFWRDRSRPRGERLRLALESLGPVFVKFGQLLSVRRDMIPEDVADELAKLQDSVPPVPWPAIAATLDAAYGRPHGEVF
ncbi:MAG TPA: ubiquinone biosynthesis regulatory protein kinase UbiB, partial [Usitatibacter sp.]